jgi:hypothetical protein
MPPVPARRPIHPIIWFLAGILVAIMIRWSMLKIFQPAAPPVVASAPAARQVIAGMAPPKNSAVGKHVMAAIEANEKDLKKPHDPQH